MKMGKKVKVNIFKPLSSWEDFGENVDDTSILGNANYLGSLYPTKAVVTEELNGNFYLEVEFLRDDASANLIKFENLIVVYGLPVLDKMPQAFRIKNYKVNRKKFTLTAKHRFYDTENYILKQHEGWILNTSGGYRIYQAAVLATRYLAQLTRKKPEDLSGQVMYVGDYWLSAIAKFYKEWADAKGLPAYTTVNSAQYAELFDLLCLNPIFNRYDVIGGARRRYLSKFENALGFSLYDYVSSLTWEQFYRSTESDGDWQGHTIVGDWDGRLVPDIIMEMTRIASGMLFRSNENYTVLESVPQSAVNNIILAVGKNIKNLEVEYSYDNFGNMIVDTGDFPRIAEDMPFYAYNKPQISTTQPPQVYGEMGAVDLKYLATSEGYDGINYYNWDPFFPDGVNDPVLVKLRQATTLYTAQLVHEQPFQYQQTVKQDDYTTTDPNTGESVPDAHAFAVERGRESVAQLRAKMADCCEPKKIFTIDVVDDPRYRDGGKSLINSIYDQATVVDDVLGINETMQVYAYKWNVLLDRVESLTLGAIPKKLKDYI